MDSPMNTFGGMAGFSATSWITPFQIKALQGGLLVSYHNSSDLAILHFLLLADVDYIPIPNPCSDHALPFAGKGKVRPNVTGEIYVVINILFRQNRSSTSNLSHQRDLFHRRQRNHIRWK